MNFGLKFELVRLEGRLLSYKLIKYKGEFRLGRHNFIYLFIFGLK